MVSLYSMRCTLIQTHSRSIFTAILLAFSFLCFSVPVAYPQNPSLLRWACFESALAPTVRKDILALYCSSALRSLLGWLNFDRSSLGLGHGWSCEPIVFLKPIILIKPYGPINITKLWRLFSTLSIFYLNKYRKTSFTRPVTSSDNYYKYSAVSSTTDSPMYIGSKDTG